MKTPGVLDCYLDLRSNLKRPIVRYFLLLWLISLGEDKLVDYRWITEIIHIWPHGPEKIVTKGVPTAGLLLIHYLRWTRFSGCLGKRNTTKMEAFAQYFDVLLHCKSHLPADETVLIPLISSASYHPGLNPLFLSASLFSQTVPECCPQLLLPCPPSLTSCLRFSLSAALPDIASDESHGAGSDHSDAHMAHFFKRRVLCCVKWIQTENTAGVRSHESQCNEVEERSRIVNCQSEVYKSWCLAHVNSPDEAVEV